MGSKPLLVVLWGAGTGVAALVAWQSLGLVSDSTQTDALGNAPRSVVDDSIPTPTPTSSSSTTSTVADPSTATSGTPSTSGSRSSTTSSSTTTQADPLVTEQVFPTIGGTVAVSFSPDGVEILWAYPAPGFQVEWHPEHGGWEVEFTSATHESKIEVWWDGGPRSEVKEGD